jgi:AMMECR1 domain-containing protein
LLGNLYYMFKKNEKQIKAVFDWLTGAADRGDLILLERAGGQKIYRFDFPLKYGDRPKQIKFAKEEDITFFINFSSRRPALEKDKWHLIFGSPELEIYEKKKRMELINFRPLRWGLGQEEKKMALKIARKALEVFLEEKRIPELKDLNLFLPPVFNLRADLAVALWVAGVFRGSRVVANRILGEGIIEAAVWAGRDSRCEPLQNEELLLARIEICLCSDLKIPVSQKFIKKNQILHDKGYFLKKDDCSGWFLPEVFNIRLFKNLDEFLGRLAEKAGLAGKLFAKKAQILIFEVDDFIEDAARDQALKLDGPVAEMSLPAEAKKIAALAAEWLVKIQASSGNFPPVVNPLTGLTLQRDWPRCLLAAFGLIEFGKAVGEQKYAEAGKKTFLYFKRFLFEEPDFFYAPYDFLASLVYFGWLAESLNFGEEALRCGQKILERIGALEFEPIIFAQIGSFFAKLSKKNREFFEPALKTAVLVKDKFEEEAKKNKSMNAVFWAESVNLYVGIFEISGDNSYLAAAQKMGEWLLGYQQTDGAFRSLKESEIVYVRGTGKIIEALAGIFVIDKKEIEKFFDAGYYEKSLNQAIGWLAKMQYAPQSAYFIPQKNLDLALGGFRHDYFNHELWVDSAGHLLLAASRLLKFQHGEKTI